MFNQLMRPVTEVVEREIDFPNGKVTLHFRQLTSSEMQVVRAGMMSRNFDERANVQVWAISKSLCNPDGTQTDDDGEPIMPIKKARELNEFALILILNEILKIGDGETGK